jgi:hypothetical protein
MPLSPSQPAPAPQLWWPVVAMLPRLMMIEDLRLEDEGKIRQRLCELGFEKEHVLYALAFLEGAQQSGYLEDVFAMALSAPSALRTQHPLERICISDHIWALICECRGRGVLGDEMVERLMEGLRRVDTRDWEDDEVCDFIEGVLVAAGSSDAAARFRDIVRGLANTFLN